jgi:hypothetical protein
MKRLENREQRPEKPRTSPRAKEGEGGKAEGRRQKTGIRSKSKRRIRKRSKIKSRSKIRSEAQRLRSCS